MSDKQKVHILLVEDIEDNRDMLTRRLLRHDYKVTSAVDGEEALELAASANPDLILMDMSLPKLDGWEVTRRLRSQAETANVRIIALTAHAMNGDEERALQAGCNDYDTKPVDLNRLLEKMKRQLAHDD
jgi:two-component system cell cycle response regulator DivK